ncbi:MAG: efflux transporter outer membrane subunit [Acidobacteria bacterium]|nr:efflux transporter outer membrane subunit [Acidobacteriota bacterium]MDA1235434.1 efflux transporter outer membrane subunit [Acidobacteriota bacterium]
MKAAVVAALILAAAGCAAKLDQPVRSFTVEPPTAWAAAPAAVEPVIADVDWWAYFGDAGLDGAISEALTHNKDLTAAAARIDLAQAQARIAGAPLLPSLSASMNRNRQRVNFIGLPIPGREDDVISSINTNVGISLNLNWEADVWGKLQSSQLAALADVEAVETDLAGARLSLTGQTAKAWFAAIEAKRQLQLAQASQESFQVSSERVRARFESGVRPSLDLRLALTAVDRAQGAVQQRRQILDASVRQLEILMGKYPAAAYELAEDLPDAPRGVPAGLPAELVSRRPDLISQERRLLAADARIAQSKAALRPSFSLTGSTGTATNQLQDLLNGEVFVWSLIGGLTQPIFNNGQLKAEVRQTEARAREAAALYENAALNAYRQVEVALAADRFLSEQETALDTATRQALKAQQLAEQRYRSGLADIITVLDAQRTAIDSESQWLAVRRARLDNRVDLHLALGGSFAMDSASMAAPQPTEVRETL